MTDLSQLPLYQSHKRVRAIKIGAISLYDGDDRIRLIPSDGQFEPFVVEESWYQKHQPVAPGYFVVDAGGYQSWSPVDAFETGYWKIGHRESRRRAVIDQVILELQERITGKGNKPQVWHEAVTALKNAYERAEQMTLTHGQ